MPKLREEITRTLLRLSGRGKVPPVPTGLGRAPSEAISREGKQLGGYRIVKRLGSGGMGHVYLALDTRLGRYVALKFLAGEAGADYSMLYRLQQEARTASALNHPNIVTVYEIGELEGEPFIASEYIDGATLRLAMQRKAIDVPTAIDVAMQVASALTAAHFAGVVHRDLKPGNIMLRPDGYVKVIDFGLAKQINAPAADRSSPGFVTQTGSVIGTVDYMSPEQARGDRVDHRTDIWSLGVVLYEMLAQRRPFEGQTDSHVIVSILDGALPPLPDADSLPPGLPRILECALAKDPAKRYPTVGDLLRDLQQISPASRMGSGIRLAALERQRSVSRKRMVIAATAAMVMLLAGVGWWWVKRTPDWFQIGSVRQLTFNGRTLLATISPDGNYLAFVVGEAGGEQTLYLKQIDSSTEEARIPARRIEYKGLTFSPDSKYLYETEKDEALMGRLYVLPILGTRPSVPLIENIEGPISFSPNGEQFAFVRVTHVKHAGPDHTASAILIASRNPADPRPRQLISLSNSTLSRIVAWSPKGNLIAAFEYSKLPDHSGQALLDLIDMNGRRSPRLLPWRVVNQPLWTSPGRAILASAATNTEGDNQAQLRELALRSGEIHDVTRDLTGYRSGSLTADGKQLAALRTESRANIWISAAGDFARGQNVLAETERHPSLAWSDETHLLVYSKRGGFPNLWLFDTLRQNRSGLTNEPYVEQEGSPVPGSNSIVLVSNRTGQSHVWRFDPDSNHYAPLTSGPNYDESPSVSPDGRSVVYTSWDSTTSHLRKVPINGGTSSQLGNSLGRYPQISPDGKWIACYLQDPSTAKWTVAIVPFDGYGEPKLFPAAQIPYRWSPDGRSLTSALVDSKGAANIWMVPVDGSDPRQLTRFDDETISAFAWSPSGARLACIRVSMGADVVLFKAPQQN